MAKAGGWRVALAAFGCLALAAQAEARTNRALLIAVTDYPNLPAKARLVGPNHDAALARDYLTTAAPVKFEPGDVTVLADKLDGATGSPTRAAILGELARLAAESAPGDFVYIHYSGHGAQQTAKDGDTETDGLDEIILPSDTGLPPAANEPFPNAIVDDEIGAALKAIRAKGAFVWIVFDACHSGTATRAVPVDPEDIAERGIDTTEFGLPPPAPAPGAGSRAVGDEEEERTAALGIDTGEAAPTGAKPLAEGGIVAFYAAQTVETAPEMPLPKGAEGAVKYGLLTYTLLSAAAANPDITYRQLGAAVLQRYAADARSKPTPMFEGLLDARVFGTEKLDTVMQWPLEVAATGMSVPAGFVQRLAPGSKLAVLPSPAAELVDALGYVEVRSAKNLVARVAPVAWNGKPALKAADLPPKPTARLAELAVDYRLKVARPPAAEGFEAETAMVDGVLDSLAKKEGTGFNVAFVAPGAEADLRLAVLPESAVLDGASDAPALFFLPASGVLDKERGQKPPLVAIDRADPGKLEKGVGDDLTKIFRAVSLSRLAAASDYRPEDFSLGFEIRGEDGGAAQVLDGAKVPVVHPGDEVHFKAENRSTKIVDLNVLYVGSDWSITHVAAERMVPGASLDEGLFAFTADTFGTERMIAVLTEAPPQSEVEDLSFLGQEGVPDATRETGGGGFAAMLADIGAAPATRSVMRLGDKGGSKGAVMIFPVETEPRE